MATYSIGDCKMAIIKNAKRSKNNAAAANATRGRDSSCSPVCQLRMKNQLKMKRVISLFYRKELLSALP